VVGAVAVALLAVMLGVAGCGSGDASRERRTGAKSVVVAKPRLAAACEELAAPSRVRAVCPAKWPRMPARARYKPRSQDLGAGACAYLVDYSATRRIPGDAAPFHMLVGGECDVLALGDLRGKGWPSPDAPLRRLRSGVLNGCEVLFLQAADYPVGGMHGGHFAAVWNYRGDGYALSVHFQRPAARVESTAIGLLDGMVRSMRDRARPMECRRS
jgi:hypothetical protein